MRELALPEEVRRRGYRAVETLGGHDFADTYRGQCQQGGEDLVIKVLDIGQIETWKQLELFERQRETLASLSWDGLPRYVDSFRLDDEGAACAIIYEFVEGEALDAVLEREGVWDEDEVGDFLDQMLATLEYLHCFSPPVIHRDIKPSNILRTPQGRYVLIDFGAVQTVLAGEAGGTTFVGTTGYMPPEQMMGRAVAASDLYALGATTVHLMSGVAPWKLSSNGVELEVERYLQASPSMMPLLKWLVAPELSRRASDAGLVRWAMESGRLPEVSDGPFEGWGAGSEREDIQCWQREDKVELELKVNEVRTAGTAYLAVGGVTALIVLFSWNLAAGGDWELGAAMMSSLVLAYSAGIPLAIWLVLRLPRRLRLERYINTSRLDWSLVWAILAPLVLVPIWLVDYLQGPVGEETVRLTLSDGEVRYRQIDKRGRKRIDHRMAKSDVRDIYLEDGHLAVEDESTQMMLDLSRIEREGARWLLHGLQRECFGIQLRSSPSSEDGQDG